MSSNLIKAGKEVKLTATDNENELLKKDCSSNNNSYQKRICSYIRREGNLSCTKSDTEFKDIWIECSLVT